MNNKYDEKFKWYMAGIDDASHGKERNKYPAWARDYNRGYDKVKAPSTEQTEKPKGKISLIQKILANQIFGKLGN